MTTEPKVIAVVDIERLTGASVALAVYIELLTRVYVTLAIVIRNQSDNYVH